MCGARAPLLACCWLLTLCGARAFEELRGTRLTGCALVENPYVKLDHTQRLGYNGIAISYLHKLQDALQFQIDVHRWNRTWSEFIDHMSACVPRSNRAAFPSLPLCECDVGIGSFTMTNDRANRIQFVWPFSNEAHQMVSRRSDLLLDESENRWFVFQTFSLNVWILVVACIVLHALGTVFFTSFEADSQTTFNTPSVRSARNCCSVYDLFGHCKRFPALVLHSYAHLIGQPIRENQMGTPSFHRSAWIVLGITTGLFLLTLYQASLTVLLFESKKSSPFRTLGDIVQCSIHPNRVAMMRGGASQDFWNKVVNTSFNRDNCKWDANDDVGITVSDLEQGFRFLTERKADFLFSLRGSIVFRATINCREYVPVGEPFFSTSVAFVLPATANQTIRHHLDNTTRFLREEDPFDTADALARANMCGDEVEATITLEKLMAFSIMYVATWLFLVGYRCVFLWRRRRRKQLAQRIEQGQRNMFVPKYPDGVIVDVSDISKSNSHGRHGTDDEDNFSEPTSGSLMVHDSARLDHFDSR